MSNFLLFFADSHIIGLQKRPLSSSKKEDISKLEENISNIKTLLKVDVKVAELKENLARLD